MQELDPWLTKIQAANVTFRKEIGATRLGLFRLAARLLAAPRTLRKGVVEGVDSHPSIELQCPWLPRWPALTATPLHDSHRHAWTEYVREARNDIREELSLVKEAFVRARYDSDLNAKQWNTYYFYLHGRAIDSHLAACPRTAEVLGKVPHNGLHVCFSAIEPGGSLHPHTGPTNASLTAHLGLAHCAGARLWVAGQLAEYRDDEVLVFDDSFVHWVENGGVAVRYTLMITFWHPELNPLEREFLRRVVHTVRQ
jgi:aspartyl/asparaginyl beta-hydroxylase (cupin superfamily)